MSGTRFVMPNQQFISVSGPGVGYLLYFYETGTDTPQNTYFDSGYTEPNANPITADANGDFGSIFLLSSPSYRVVLTDANGVQIWTMDPVGPNAGGGGTGGTVPIGAMFPYGGATAPSGYLLCYGQAVSRTTYAGLFAITGTAYGSGDGTTTFNLPDKRGRTSIGVDNMGGVAANRITSGVCGINGVTLGAAGGDQATQQHNHSVTDPGHTHSLTDPGHQHNENVPQGSGSISAWFLQLTGSLFNPAGLVTASATTGITMGSQVTGISIAAYGAGGSQNVQPSEVDSWIIRAQ